MDKKRLVELISEQLSTRDIALKLGTSQTNIRYWLKKYDFKTKHGRKGGPRDKSVERKCACGEVDPLKFYGNKKTVCAKCHNAYNSKKGREQRVFMLDFLGGKCVSCSYNKYSCSLDVHHTDPAKKDVGFSTARYWNRDRLIKELENCVLLCKNCHAAHHSGHEILTE